MWEYEDKAAFALLKELVYSTNTIEFSIARFNTNNLLLIGSFDLSYYHEAEFVFEDVFYIEIYQVVFHLQRYDLQRQMKLLVTSI
jgi:hypothetical protein